MTAAPPTSGRSRIERDRGRGLFEAAKVALLHPAAWPVALAGFLARGGILLFVLPVVVLPTPTGLATLFGPDIIAVAIGGPTVRVLGLVVVAALAVGGWLLLASFIGAVADASLVAWAAAALDARDRPAVVPLGGARLVVLIRVAAVRLVCHLPLLLAGSWALTRIVGAVYREYISPGDLAVPLLLRVARSVPEAIALLLAAWLIGEALGGVAARAVVLDGRPVGAAVRRAVGSVVLHPVAATASLLAGTAAVAAIALPLGAMAGAWDGLRDALLGAAEPTTVTLSTLAFAATWLAALVVVGAATSLRSVAWTWFALRLRERPAIALAPVATPEAVAVEA